MGGRSANYCLPGADIPPTLPNPTPEGQSRCSTNLRTFRAQRIRGLRGALVFQPRLPFYFPDDDTGTHPLTVQTTTHCHRAAPNTALQHLPQRRHNPHIHKQTYYSLSEAVGQLPFRGRTKMGNTTSAVLDNIVQGSNCRNPHASMKKPTAHD